MTADELFWEVLAGRMALCVACETVTRAPVPVRCIESTSGPGATLHACPDRAAQFAPGSLPGELEVGA